MPLIRHDSTGWEPIEDQDAARAAPIEKVRQPVAHAVVVGAAKAPHRSAAPFRRRVRRRRSWWASDGARRACTRAADTTLQARYVAVLLTCRSCLRNRDADLEALIAGGHGAAPLIGLR